MTMHAGVWICGWGQRGKRGAVADLVPPNNYTWTFWHGLSGRWVQRIAMHWSAMSYNAMHAVNVQYITLHYSNTMYLLCSAVPQCKASQAKVGLTVLRAEIYCAMCWLPPWGTHASSPWVTNAEGCTLDFHKIRPNGQIIYIYLSIYLSIYIHSLCTYTHIVRIYICKHIYIYI